MAARVWAGGRRALERRQDTWSCRLSVPPWNLPWRTTTCSSFGLRAKERGCRRQGCAYTLKLATGSPFGIVLHRTIGGTPQVMGSTSAA